MMRRRVVPLFLIALAPSIPRPTGACSLEPQHGGEWYEDPIDGDVVAPTRVTVNYYVVRPPEGNDIGCAESCGPGPNLLVFRVSALDDIVAPNALGYRFRAVGDGRLPRGLAPVQTLYPNPAMENGLEIGLDFSREAGSLSFDMEITALDRNGNESEPIVVTIDG